MNLVYDVYCMTSEERDEKEKEDAKRKKRQEIESRKQNSTSTYVKQATQYGTSTQQAIYSSMCWTGTRKKKFRESKDPLNLVHSR